ncbi:MAG: HAD family hydrolase [Rhizobiaceae bacterium]|nr:HAD family hydrolase [Rhizobiaceae bacterium]
MPHPPAELIIFDCDGVLVDSEPISIAVLVQVIVEAGGSITEEAAYRSFLGRSMASVGEILSTDYGFVITGEHLASMRLELWRRFREELKPTPGIAAVLPGLSMLKCVASSGSPERIRLSLGLTGLLEMLEPNLYSAAMVERGKPAPDLFLHAARGMGVRPEACIVVEDSPAGIVAAQRAGMRVFAYHGASHAHRAGLAASLSALCPDRLFDDMAQLPDLISGGDSRAKAS